MFVYILTNKSNSTFYVGVTNNMEKRLAEHMESVPADFVKKYNMNKLVYLEQHQSIQEAIAREKQLKNWHRQWKLNLIASNNPQFLDLRNRGVNAEILKRVQDDDKGGVSLGGAGRGS